MCRFFTRLPCLKQASYSEAKTETAHDLAASNFNSG